SNKRRYLVRQIWVAPCAWARTRRHCRKTLSLLVYTVRWRFLSGTVTGTRSVMLTVSRLLKALVWCSLVPHQMGSWLNLWSTRRMFTRTWWQRRRTQSTSRVQRGHTRCLMDLWLLLLGSRTLFDAQDGLSCIVIRPDQLKNGNI